ncbi:hypothetical protein KIK84_00285 [Curvibacter sp. CHRR-16]|uniref:COG4648 family protein n=1 Tax=Curvibacter sp. CHRR-16 TaxID=2835872 RepID=UPI001BDA810D|nr:hypothetical protein [Curvibacter sp. CHRR-16]MBT0568748.1 hypothetical protein [Curvibacter sp. CHRR-16]
MPIQTVRVFFNGLLTLAYPLVILGGLYWGSPRMVALLLLGMLLLRRWANTMHLLRTLGVVDKVVFAALVAHALWASWSGSELWVRLYPCAVTLSLLAVFARSLYTPQSMVERIARLSEPDLPTQAIAYTRAVTRVWCGFMACNAAVSLWTALQADRAIWAIYNGGISYVLMGLLFAGEWLYRRRYIARAELKERA